MFRDYEKVSGLKMNLQKTEMLCRNTEEGLIRQIEEEIGIKVVRKLTYLGLEIRESYEESKNESYNKCKE